MEIIPAKGQRKRQTKVFQEWLGSFTQSARIAIPQNYFFYQENIQPIGYSNMRSVLDKSASLHDYAADSIYWMQPANINNVDYEFLFATNGKVFAYNIGTGVSAQINAGPTLLSGANSRMAQWKNQIALFIDSTGYYYWDGTTFAKITGSGAPASGTDIAVYAGRVWIAQARVLFFSGADGFSNGVPAIPDATNYWSAVNGAGFVNLTDPVLHSNVQRLFAANGYLYIHGTTSVNVISDVYVPAGAVPPTPLFTNLNVQSIIGTDQPASVFTFGRALMLANRYGAYAMYGVNAQRFSSDIDGTWQYVDFTQPVSGAVAVINNILCAAFLIKRLNDPIFGSNTVLAMYQEDPVLGKGKWWFANFGAATFIATGMVQNAPAIFALIGNKLYQLFANSAQSPNTLSMTPLWSMGDPTTDKQVIRAGIQVSLRTLVGAFTLSVDNLIGSFIIPTLASVGGVAWQNNSMQLVQWQNNALQTVTWFGGSYITYSGAASGAYSPYVGLTLTSTGSIFELNAMFMDFEMSGRFVG